MPDQSEPNHPPVRIIPMHHLAKGGRWRTEAMRSYRTPLLLWFSTGQGRITVSGTRRGYGPNTAVFIPAETMHGFDMAGHVYGSAVFFDDTQNLPLPVKSCFLRIQNAQRQSAIVNLLDALQRELQENLPCNDTALASLTGLLAIWLHRQMLDTVSFAQEVEKEANLLARRFTASVERQIYTGQSITEYAEHLGVDESALEAACKESCQRSASDILRDRLEYEARQLLRRSSMPPERVAQMLGFAPDADLSILLSPEESRTG